MVGSGAIFKAMNSSVTMNLSTIFKLTGINFTVSAACASGSHAIGIAYQLIKSGLQDCIICGGTQEINELAMGSFDGLGVFSVNDVTPGTASRPFDKSRDGLVPSGGAASLIVESYESAKKECRYFRRNYRLRIFIQWRPYLHSKRRWTYIGHEKAIDQAQIQPKEIDYVNAHATSTPVGFQ